MLAKVGTGQESHGRPPGYYLVLFWVTFFPGSLLAGLAAPAVWHYRREAGAKFLLAWIVPSWLVFEIVATKLPHYVLPLYPAIAIIIAGVLDHHALSLRTWLMRGTVWWFLITAILVTGLIAAHVIIGQQMGLLAWPFAAAAVIFSFSAWWLYVEDGAERSLLRASAAAVLISIAAFGATIPQLPALFPSNQIARYVRNFQCKPEVVSTIGYYEPSLVFLLGDRHGADRRHGRRGFSCRRRLPLRSGRKEPGARLRAARGKQRAALCARAAGRGHQSRRWPVGVAHGVPVGTAVGCVRAGPRGVLARPFDGWWRTIWQKLQLLRTKMERRWLPK